METIWEGVKGGSWEGGNWDFVDLVVSIDLVDWVDLVGLIGELMLLLSCVEFDMSMLVFVRLWCETKEMHKIEEKISEQISVMTLNLRNSKRPSDSSMSRRFIRGH